jgi:predicted nuclease with TOPRIM domain
MLGIEKRKGSDSMKVYSEISLENFEAWSGAVNTLDRIRNAGKCDVLESILEESYPDGLSETGLNDILWFEPEWCYEMCGMRTESKIREELEEAQSELENLKEDFEDTMVDCADARNAYREIAGMNKLDDEEMESLRSEVWANNYADDAAELEEKIHELEEELEDL